MSETRWTREALEARLAASDVLQAQPAGSAARAMWRLELLDIIAAVDAGRIPPAVAVEQLEQLQLAVLEHAQLT